MFEQIMGFILAILAILILTWPAWFSLLLVMAVIGHFMEERKKKKAADTKEAERKELIEDVASIRAMIGRDDT